MKRLAVFGTGLFWDNRKKYVLGQCEIVCFLDNNPDKWNRQKDGCTIVPPESVNMYDYDVVLIMSRQETAMRQQLNDMGIDSDVIWTWPDYCREEMAKLTEFHGVSKDKVYDIIIVTTDMCYAGGIIVVMYAAKVMMERGKKVLMCAPSCDAQFLKELLGEGIDVMTSKALPYAIPHEMQTVIQNSQVVIVNVFQMIAAAVQISRIKPVLWWIHEYLSYYPPIMEEFRDYATPAQVSCGNINIKTVSTVALKWFKMNYPSVEAGVMPLGIPDVYREGETYDGTHYRKAAGEISFAVLGGVLAKKGQDTFLDAICMLSDEERQQAKFLIIGHQKDTSGFAANIAARAADMPEVIVTGNLPMEEMKSVYAAIDVVVCSSVEETFCMTVVEGMMHKKPCIITDEIGAADYVKDGDNGFVMKVGDAAQLCEHMRYFIHNRNEVERMGERARTTYENNFSPRVFGDRLEQAIDETVRKACL